MAENNLILVRLAKKFADRIFHEFNDNHPHQTTNGGEALVTGDRVVSVAPTTAVRSAIMQGILEEVREPNAVASPEGPNVLDVVNGEVKPGVAAPAAAPAASSEPAAESTPAPASGAKSGK